MLESIKVISFTHYLQGPVAAQTLAYMGADVIKVEAQKGAFERSWSGANSFIEDVSIYFLAVDRNQRSIAVDLKTEEGNSVEQTSEVTTKQGSTETSMISLRMPTF